MQYAELATRLVNSSDANRETLLSENAVLADVELAYKLKDICLEGWSTHPAQALGAAASLQLLSDLRTHPEIKALSRVGCRSSGTHRRRNGTSDF